MADDHGDTVELSGDAGGEGRAAETGARKQSKIPLDLGKPTVSVEEIQPETESIEGRRENVRGVLAAFLVAILGATILASVALLANDRIEGSEVELIAQLFVTPLVAIVGSVVGFYFGGQVAQGGDASNALSRRRR